MRYTVTPGLYALGNPDEDSEVLVTANFRMTFDMLRRALPGLNAWILVLDTRGINVWCAAGKGTFGTEQLIRRIGDSDLGSIVTHGRIIVPQLGAVGVAAHEVKTRTGFSVIYGPVEARDIPAFLAAHREATPAMRRKEFPFKERAALAPMELIPAVKWAAAAVAIFALVEGLAGPGDFLNAAARAGLQSGVFLSFALLSGAVLVPVMLPWIPGKAFAVKGAVVGTAAAGFLAAMMPDLSLKGAAWTLFVVAASSFIAMNFTGSSTYTSLSGVKKEMNMAVPAQIVAVVAGLAFWIGSLFLNGGPGA
jgi:acetyl-CoA decarbonylase/synthase complex subunit gamma